MVSIDSEVVARDAAQDHPFQAIQIVESVAGRFVNGGQQRFTGIVANQAQQLAQGNNQILAATLLESLKVIGDFGRGFQNRLFFRMGIAAFDAFPTRRAVFEQSDALLSGFGNAAVGDDTAEIELDFDLIFGFAHLDTATNPGDWHGIAIRVQRDVSFHIHDALMKPVYLGNPGGQRFQMRLFGGKQLARNGAEMFFVCRIDAIAPLARLKIQIVPTGESASGKEVVLDKVEGPFDAARTVRIAQFVGSELETEAFAEGLHLRHRNHPPPRAAQHNHVRVVDHDPTASAAEKTQGVGQEDFAVEPLERGVALKEQHARVAQHGRCGLRAAFFSGDLDQMRRGVMLKLFAGRKLVESGWQFRLLTDAMTAAKGRQRRIRQSESLGHKLFMDPDEIALAVDPLVQNLLPVRLRFLRPVQYWYIRGLRPQDFAYG